MSEPWTAAKIDALSWDEIRKLCCVNGIKVKGKKVVLIAALKYKLVRPQQPVSEHHAANNGGKLVMEVDKPAVPRVNDTFLISADSLANSTYIIEESFAPKRDAELFLSADETILAGNVDVPQTETIVEKENIVRVEELAKNLGTSAPSGITRQPRSQESHRGINSGPKSNRFKKQHERQFAKMEAIVDTQKKREERQQKAALCNSQTTRIDQLATPKDQQVRPSAERRSYTPNRSPYRYVDTTKMNDEQFHAYRLRQEQEKNGIFEEDQEKRRPRRMIL